MMKTPKNLKLLGVIAILGASLAVSGFVIQDAMAASGANKTAYYTGDTQEIFEDDGYVSLAITTLKTAKPTDVLILYNEECSLYTEIQLKSKKAQNGQDGEEVDTARAAQMIQLYVDDYAYGPPITMCDRTFGIQSNILNQIQELCVSVDNLNTIGEQELLECDESFLRLWIDTKSAHGWNWVVVNLGQDPDFSLGQMHTIEVKGLYIDEDDTPNDVDTEAVVVGQRSLIVIKTHLDVAAENLEE
jgi:hypothetical protein